MQNLSTTHAADIREKGEILVPAGHGRTSFIDVRDIAAFAVLALTEKGHENAAYSLTGSEALTYSEVSKTMTQELGRPIVYLNPSILRFVIAARKNKLPWMMIGVMIGIYTVAKMGYAGSLTTEVRRLLQRDPILLRQFVRDNRDAWE